MKKSTFKELSNLIFQEFILEWRLKSAIYSALLFVVSMLIMVSISFREGISDTIWYTTYWLVVFFTSLQTIGKTFIGESEEILRYRYQLVHATSLILAKIIYNCFLQVIIISIVTVLYLIFLGKPNGDLLKFLPVILLGVLNLASCLTLVSAIVSTAGNNGSLMPTLSLPILFPQLLLILRLSNQAMGGILFTKDIYYSCALIVVNVILSLILFPILWRQ